MHPDVQKSALDLTVIDLAWRVSARSRLSGAAGHAASPICCFSRASGRLSRKVCIWPAGSWSSCACARAAQGRLHVAHPIDAVGGNPGEGHACRNRAFDHADGKPWLGRKTRSLRHMGCRQARRSRYPGLREQGPYPRLDGVQRGRPWIRKLQEYATVMLAGQAPASVTLLGATRGVAQFAAQCAAIGRAHIAPAGAAAIGLAPAGAATQAAIRVFAVPGIDAAQLRDLRMGGRGQGQEEDQRGAHPWPDGALRAAAPAASADSRLRAIPPSGDLRYLPSHHVA